jgi:hypothetical protein
MKADGLDTIRSSSRPVALLLPNGHAAWNPFWFGSLALCPTAQWKSADKFLQFRDTSEEKDISEFDLLRFCIALQQ